MNELRNLTKEERKQWKQDGEVSNLDIIIPYFSWQKATRMSNTSGLNNEAILTLVANNSIVQLPIGAMVGCENCYLVSFSNYAGVNENIFFPIEQFDRAVNTFNAVVAALEKTNNF